MYVSSTHSASASERARLGENHGYAFDRDQVRLRADLHGAALPPHGRPALELWACPAAYAGGQLEGVRVASLDLAAVAGAAQAGTRSVEGQVPAAVPAGCRDYAMVLALTEEAAQGRQVRQFANYPRRERFLGPELTGSVGYAIEGDQVVLSVDAIRNARAAGSLSGSLSLELRAQRADAPVRHGEGELLACVDLLPLAGQASSLPLALRTAFTQPSFASARLSLVLREWAGASGRVARDWSTFAALHQRPQHPAPAPRLAEVIELHGHRAQPASSASRPAIGVAQEQPSVVAKAPRTPSDVSRASAEPAPAGKTIAEPVPSRAEQAAASRTPGTSERAAQPGAAPPAQSAAPESTRVSISRASIDQLAAVKGLNRKLAHAIVKGRPFSTLDELVKVRGIGPKILKTLKQRLEL